jgi:hypothetical protein
MTPGTREFPGSDILPRPRIFSSDDNNKFKQNIIAKIIFIMSESDFEMQPQEGWIPWFCSL